MIEFWIYLADVSEGLQQLCIIASVCSGISYTILKVLFVSYPENFTDGGTAIKTYARSCGIIFAVTIFFAIFTPSKQTIYTIGALELGKEISKSEKVNVLSDKVYRVLNSKLDEMLKDKK